MKIESSSVSMSSRHSLVESYTREESLIIRGNGMRMELTGGPPEGRTPAGLPAALQLDAVELSGPARSLQAQYVLAEVRQDQEVEFELSDKDKQKLLLLQQMVEYLTGREIKFELLDRFRNKDEVTCYYLKAVNNDQPAPPARQGWGMAYDYHESYLEKETLSFKAHGIVKTEDGREINFAVQLNMSRHFYAEQSISIRAGAALVDPLVINFQGTAPELTNTKFYFDLDGNGVLDQISFVAPGSGFLAIDLNGDGVINDGRELFGPGTGNGFAELAAYDHDRNGWIDENDPVFDRLLIWSRDAAGRDSLDTLKQKGIGAIYLGNIHTPFGLKDQANVLHGQVQSTGIFLRENGTVGTLQQIDLAV